MISLGGSSESCEDSMILIHNTYTVIKYNYIYIYLTHTYLKSFHVSISDHPNKIYELNADKNYICNPHRAQHMT